MRRSPTSPSRSRTARSRQRHSRRCIARIAAYDKQGSTINAVISLNPNALSEARALDAERKAGNIRGPLHGIPIVLKDNFNTGDLQTTGGSQLLDPRFPSDA
jgi:amidase